jgi:hypothetical protein
MHIIDIHISSHPLPHALGASLADAAARDAAGLAPIAALLEDARSAGAGLAPLLGLAGRLHRAGIGAFVFGFGPEVDAKDSSTELPSLCA